MHNRFLGVKAAVGALNKEIVIVVAFHEYCENNENRCQNCRALVGMFMGTVITDNTHCAQSPPFTPATATGQWIHAFQSKYLVTNQHLTLNTYRLFLYQIKRTLQITEISFYYIFNRSSFKF